MWRYAFVFREGSEVTIYSLEKKREGYDGMPLRMIFRILWFYFRKHRKLPDHILLTRSEEVKSEFYAMFKKYPGDF